MVLEELCDVQRRRYLNKRGCLPLSGQATQDSGLFLLATGMGCVSGGVRIATGDSGAQSGSIGISTGASALGHGGDISVSAVTEQLPEEGGG